MRKTKKIGLSIRILIVALVIALGFFIFKQVSNTIRLKHSNQQALATDYNIEGDLCLEIENGPVENPCKGDLNKDGYITRADTVYLNKYSANLQTGITVDDTLADINNDGEVTAADARIVLRIATYINDYRNYMLNEAEGIDLQDMISYVGEDYLKNCNTLFVGESIIIAPNFELSDKNSTASRAISAGSSDPDVAIIEVVDDTKVKVTAKGVGDVQIIVTSDEDPQTIGVLNLRVYGKMNIVGEETVDNYKVGDINTDGIITDYDAIELLAYTAGINSVLEEKEIELDINKDGKVTAADARIVLRLSEYLDGKLETLDSSDIEIWGNNVTEIYNTLYVGEIFTLKAVDSDGTEFNNINWSSSDTNIITVENGTVTALSEGRAKITVTNSDNTLAASITFMVNGSKIDRATQLEYVDNGDGTCKIIGYTGTNAVLVIPENINQLKVVEIGDNAFKDCISLNRIEISSNVAKVGENAFSGCINLHTVCVPSAYNKGTEGTLQDVSIALTELVNAMGYENIYDYCFDMITYINHGEYCSIDGAFTGSAICAVPSSICGKTVTTIDEYCFQTSINTQGTVVKIPETVTTIGKKAFSSKVTRIVWLTEKGPQDLNVTTDAFDSNAKVICLTNKGLYNKLKNDGYAVNVVGVVHTDNNQLVVGDQNSTIFGYVEPGWENEKVYDYLGANGDRIRIYPLAFANNTAIEKIDIRGWSKFVEVGNGAFMNCSNLAEVYLPSNVTTVGIKAFYNCTGLNELILPEKINSIGRYAFDGMNGTVYYPSNIKSVIDAYEGTFDNFVEIKLDSVILKNLPTKTEYYAGDTLDISGLKLVEIYNSGETKEITTGFKCTPTKLETAGVQTITITYKEKTLTFEVTVNEVKANGIEVKTEPTRVNYVVGDNLDTEGLVITATYNNGTTEEITTGFECTPTQLGTVGEQEITVTYEGKTAIFKVTVEEPKVESIAIKTKPTTENYFVGDTLNTEGLVITATYNNGTTKEIRSGLECTPTKLDTAGEQVITVTYEGKTATFKVTVEEPKVESIAIKTKPTTDNYFVGDTLNTQGLVITVTYNNGTTKDIANGLECTPMQLGTAGEQEITVTYEGKTAKFTVTVIEEFEPEDVLKDDSEYKVEEEGNTLYIDYVMPKTAIEDFKKQIETGYEIEIYDVNGNKVTDEKEYVKTDMKMIAYKNGEKVGEYILVVIGDCNGTGTTNVSDLTKLMISVAESLGTNKDESKILKGAYEKAVDLNEDGKINIVDVTTLCMFIAENK